MIQVVNAEELKLLLSDNKFKTFFTHLQSYIEANKRAEPFLNELLHHRGNYSQIKEQSRLGTLNPTEKNRAESQLRLDLFAFIDVIFPNPSNQYPVIIILDLDIDKLSNDIIEAIEQEVARILKINQEEVKINKIEKGSVKLSVNLTKEQGAQLKKLVDENSPELKTLKEKYRLETVQVPKRKVIGPKDIPKDSNAGPQSIMNLVHRRRTKIFAPIAATIAILMVFMTINYKSNINSNIDWITFEALKKTNFQLPDASNLVLNKGTTIRYAKKFESNRKIEIVEGDVYFDVVKDALHPFIVQVKNLQVKVLGTKFYITQTNQDTIYFSVKEGQIAVSKLIDSLERSTRLTIPLDSLIAGEQLAVGEPAKIFKSSLNPDIFAWETNQFPFDRGIPAIELLPELANKFKVEFIEISRDSCDFYFNRNFDRYRYRNRHHYHYRNHYPYPHFRKGWVLPQEIIAALDTDELETTLKKLTPLIEFEFISSDNSKINYSINCNWLSKINEEVFLETLYFLGSDVVFNQRANYEDLRSYTNRFLPGKTKLDSIYVETEIYYFLEWAEEQKRQ